MSRLETRLLRQLGQADRRFGLITPGDRVMVAVSGGKDSWAMLHLLRRYRRKVPFEFDLIAVNLDQGHPGFPAEVLRNYLEAEGYSYRIVYRDTHSVVQANTPEGKAFCALCSRMRRGILHRIADELGANRIALGHHRDDLIETLLLNLFFAGRVRSMAPRLDPDEAGATIIRPLALCAEAEIAEYAAAQQFPIVPCDLCGSQENLRRQEIKRLLARLEQNNPRLRGNLLAALGNVEPSHLLDARLRRVEPAAEADKRQPPIPSPAPNGEVQLFDPSTEQLGDAARAVGALLQIGEPR